MTDSLGSSSLEVMNNGKAECGCCFFEFVIEHMVQCAKGHRSCFGCVRRQVEEIIYGSFKAHSSLPCMDMDSDDDCTESIALSEIQRALPDDVIERYEECQARESVIEAKLENLVYCPFCSIPCEVDKCVHVFDCPNPKCLIASCIQCKEPSHIPLSCEENEFTSETASRRKVEERMTKAVIRECKTCNTEIVKMRDGCNRLTCPRCSTTMCYVCRQVISSSYDHFCDHYRQPEEPCQICKVDKCSMWGAEVEDDVALDAKQDALKEFGDKEPKLLDQKIGPPLVKQTVAEPSQRLLRYYNVYTGDQVANRVLQGNEDAHKDEFEFEFEGNLQGYKAHTAEYYTGDPFANRFLQGNEDAHKDDEFEFHGNLQGYKAHGAEYHNVYRGNHQVANRVLQGNEDANKAELEGILQGNKAHRAELAEEPYNHYLPQNVYLPQVFGNPITSSSTQIVRGEGEMQLHAKENDAPQEQSAEDTDGDIQSN